MMSLNEYLGFHGVPPRNVREKIPDFLNIRVFRIYASMMIKPKG